MTAVKVDCKTKKDQTCAEGLRCGQRKRELFSTPQKDHYRVNFDPLNCHEERGVNIKPKILTAAVCVCLYSTTLIGHHAYASETEKGSKTLATPLAITQTINKTNNTNKPVVLAAVQAPPVSTVTIVPVPTPVPASSTTVVKTVQAPVQVQVATPATIVTTSPVKVVPASAPSVPKSLEAKNATANVTGLNFKKTPQGSAQLVIDFDKPLAITDVRKDINGDVVVQVNNAHIPSSLSHALSVGGYQTPIKSVEIQNLGVDKDGVSRNTIRLIQDPKSTVKTKAPILIQAGNKYIIDVPTDETVLSQRSISDAVSADIGNNIQGANAFAGYVPDTRVVGSGQRASVVSQVRPVSSSSSSSRRDANPVYSGKPITFNFQDVPVRTVLQLIAEEAGINIVAADSVDGNVTLKLDAVPWDQALDTVLRAKSLDKRRQGSVLWVAPQKEISAYEQAKEDARIALDNRADLTTEYIQINYHNAAAIYKSLTEAKGVGGGGAENTGNSETGFLSPRGRLIVDERTNTLMISDIPRKIQQLKELISIIDRPVDQVLIEARVVVASETYARELGGRFGLNGSTNGGKNSIGNNIESLAGESGIGRGPMSNTSVVNALGSAALSFLRGGINLDLELSAMEKNGRGEVVSNPRLVTTNQRQAVISQGKEVGFVTVASSQGSTPTPNVQFKEALLEMKVTPTITNDGRVFLDVNVRKDDVDGVIDTSIGQIPQFSKRQINTAVLVEDGQTVVVGGVYEFTDGSSLSKVPFLGDVPFLGNFFKKRGKTKEKAELLIFITPKVLQVSQPAQSVRALIPALGNK